MVGRRRERESGGSGLARGLACLVLTAGLIVVPGLALQPAYAAQTFVVNSAADDDDGSCDVGPGDCTLREAINAANALSDADTINFSIGTGAQTITPGPGPGQPAFQW